MFQDPVQRSVNVPELARVISVIVKKTLPIDCKKVGTVSPDRDAGRQIQFSGVGTGEQILDGEDDVVLLVVIEAGDLVGILERRLAGSCRCKCECDRSGRVSRRGSQLPLVGDCDLVRGIAETAGKTSAFQSECHRVAGLACSVDCTGDGQIRVRDQRPPSRSHDRRASLVCQIDCQTVDVDQIIVKYERAGCSAQAVRP